MIFGDWVTGKTEDGFFVSGLVCGHMKDNRTKILVINPNFFTEFVDDDVLKVVHGGHEKECRKMRRNFLKEFPNMLGEMK